MLFATQSRSPLYYYYYDVRAAFNYRGGLFIQMQTTIVFRKRDLTRRPTPSLPGSQSGGLWLRFLCLSLHHQGVAQHASSLQFAPQRRGVAWRNVFSGLRPRHKTHSPQNHSAHRACSTSGPRPLANSVSDKCEKQMAWCTQIS